MAGKQIRRNMRADITGGSCKENRHSD
jgi:hypothetical protein